MKLEELQKKITNVIYGNFTYSISNLIKIFDNADPERMKEAINDKVIIGDDYINIKVEINLLAYGLKLLNDLEIPVESRAAAIENLARKYSNIDD